MEFLLYLSPVGQQIINSVSLTKFKIQENAHICRKYKEVFGFTNTSQLIICTDNIKNSISPVNYYVNETVYHEAVHIAQMCKQRPLGINISSLSPSKMNDIVRSTQYAKDAFPYEVEAYYLEDKPEKVLSYVQKFCF